MKKPKKTKKKIPEKIPARYFRVYDCIFNQRVHVLLNYSKKMYEQWVKRNKLVLNNKLGLGGDFGGFVTSLDYIGDTDKFERVLFICSFQWSIKDQATLIHEITHVIMRIWGENNIPITLDTQEFLAHSIGNMYEDIGKRLLVKI